MHASYAGQPLRGHHHSVQGARGICGRRAVRRISPPRSLVGLVWQGHPATRLAVLNWLCSGLPGWASMPPAQPWHALPVGPGWAATVGRQAGPPAHWLSWLQGGLPCVASPGSCSRPPGRQRSRLAMHPLQQRAASTPALFLTSRHGASRTVGVRPGRRELAAGTPCPTPKVPTRPLTPQSTCLPTLNISRLGSVHSVLKCSAG